MPVDAKLLEILVCPEDKDPLQVVTLPEAVRTRLVENYREQFKDEEPVVEQALACAACQRVYPIVSDIPVMLIDEALSQEDLQGTA